MKKVLSIFLALAMLISLIPAAFAADKVAEPKTYNLFNADATSNTSLKTTTPDNPEYTLSREIDGKTYYLRDKYWKRYDERGWRLFDASNDTIKTTFRLYATETDKFLQIGQSKSGYYLTLDLAVSLEAPETSGFYIPKMKGGSASTTRYEINWNLDLLSSGESTPAYKETADLVFSGSKRRSDAEFNATKAIYSKPEDEIISWMHSDIEHTYGFYYITLDPILEPDMTTVIDNGDDSTSSELSFDLTDNNTLNDSLKVTLTTKVSGMDSSEKEVNTTVSNNFITYESSNPLVATVDADGTITAQGGGTATIYAVADKNNTSLDNGITVNVTEEPDDDSELEEAFNTAFDADVEPDVEYNAPTVTGVTVDNDVITSTSGTVKGAFNLTADEVNEDGKNFLYWAKAMTLSKKIISFSNKLTNYMSGVNDKNEILIAVYEGDVPEQEEWYNANGQRIATDAAPEEYPSMAGYGTAEGWDDYSDKIHVARYASKTPTAGIDVTVVNGNGSGEDLTYGNTVTCTADEEKYGTFKCWTKTGINGNTEIVSVDKEYIFQAWETCTVTAVYDEDYTYNGNTMKIILDSFTAGNEKAVMAEFIGFGNKAVEKGIIWNGTKIAMTKPGTQFTLTGVAGDTFTGYAIVDNGDGTHSEVTDGTITLD